MIKSRILLKWDELPDFMKTEEVYPYWKQLNCKREQLFFKRVCDFILCIFLIVLLAIPMVVIAISVKIDSKGPVCFKQTRVTQYGRKFVIYKFRTMYDRKEKFGSEVTVANDERITKVGRILRKYHLDEFPQLFNVLAGDMSFVGPRPEVIKYVEKYKKEYYATLLLPAGITSEASIRFKDEEKLLEGVEDVDKFYLEQVLPQKMKYNLRSISRFNVFADIITMVRTSLGVLGRNNVK